MFHQVLSGEESLLVEMIENIPSHAGVSGGGRGCRDAGDEVRPGVITAFADMSFVAHSAGLGSTTGQRGAAGRRV